ncbi:hypothetical protein FWC63_02675 [Candidatus Saccharibacteria bacterium]|nr:hypothetical protein [Candidatus Saccharibacteria bacterium]
MKYLVFYRKQRDYTQATEDLLEDLRRQYHKEFEYVDPDTPAGVETTHAYDIMNHPTFLVVMQDGREISRHTGLPLPTVADLAAMFVHI